MISTGEHLAANLRLTDDYTTDRRPAMSDPVTRAMLEGVGEHICAVLQLGDDYTNAEYIEAVTAAREAGAGELYATRVLGADVDAIIRGVEMDDGDSIVLAAERDLRRRGIDAKKATYAQYADALVEVSA